MFLDVPYGTVPPPSLMVFYGLVWYGCESKLNQTKMLWVIISNSSPSVFQGLLQPEDIIEHSFISHRIMPKFPAVETQTQKIGNENIPKVGNMVAVQEEAEMWLLSQFHESPWKQKERWKIGKKQTMVKFAVWKMEHERIKIAVLRWGKILVFFFNQKLLMQSQTREAIFFKLWFSILDLENIFV